MSACAAFQTLPKTSAHLFKSSSCSFPSANATTSGGFIYPVILQLRDYKLFLFRIHLIARARLCACMGPSLLCPIPTDDRQSLFFPQVDARPSGVCDGLGLFAAQRLSKNDALPYYGILSIDQTDANKKVSDRAFAHGKHQLGEAYFFEQRCTFADAVYIDPEGMGLDCGLCIACRINELPAKSSGTYNCEFSPYSAEHFSGVAARYAVGGREMLPPVAVVRFTRPIEAGEELYVYYGDEYESMRRRCTPPYRALKCSASPQCNIIQKLHRATESWLTVSKRMRQLSEHKRAPQLPGDKTVMFMEDGAWHEVEGGGSRCCETAFRSSMCGEMKPLVGEWAQLEAVVKVHERYVERAANSIHRRFDKIVPESDAARLLETGLFSGYSIRITSHADSSFSIRHPREYGAWEKMCNFPTGYGSSWTLVRTPFDERWGAVCEATLGMRAAGERMDAAGVWAHLPPCLRGAVSEAYSEEEVTFELDRLLGTSMLTCSVEDEKVAIRQAVERIELRGMDRMASKTLKTWSPAVLSGVLKKELHDDLLVRNALVMITTQPQTASRITPWVGTVDVCTMHVVTALQELSRTGGTRFTSSQISNWLYGNPFYKTQRFSDLSQKVDAVLCHPPFEAFEDGYCVPPTNSAESLLLPGEAIAPEKPPFHTLVGMPVIILFDADTRVRGTNGESVARWYRGVVEKTRHKKVLRVDWGTGEAPYEMSASGAYEFPYGERVGDCTQTRWVAVTVPSKALRTSALLTACSNALALMDMDAETVADPTDETVDIADSETPRQNEQLLDSFIQPCRTVKDFLGSYANKFFDVDDLTSRIGKHKVGRLNSIQWYGGSRICDIQSQNSLPPQSACPCFYKRWSSRIDKYRRGPKFEYGMITIGDPDASQHATTSEETTLQSEETLMITSPSAEQRLKSAAPSLFEQFMGAKKKLKVSSGGVSVTWMSAMTEQFEHFMDFRLAESMLHAAEPALFREYTKEKFQSKLGQRATA